MPFLRNWGTLAEIRFLDSAIYDRIDAKEIIRAFFISKKSPELIEKQIALFDETLERKLNLLRNNPALYAVRKDGVFKDTQENFRSFMAHWFMVFYTYYDETVDIWFIRPQHSDFSKFL